MPRSTSAVLTLLTVTVAGCAPATIVGSPTAESSTSYVVRLGTDTTAVERYSRAGNRIESAIVQRSPVTYVGNSNIELGPDGLPRTWRYETRLANGARPPGGATVLMTFGPESTTYQVTRDTGVASSRRIAVSGIPSLTNSMLTQNLAIAYARLQGRDSVAVPTISVNGNAGTMPVRFVTRDSVRVWYFGSPMIAKLDADGQIRWLDGTGTTNKILAVRSARADLPAIASAFTAREQMAGAMGTASPRDTARAQIRGATLWVDYSRPALRGRTVWRNGVLGDTLWRTGANGATQFRTTADLRIAGQHVPAGLYTLWTHVYPGNSRYELIINRQTGQWGTDYDPAQDLVRVPLTVREQPSSLERFTFMIEPGGDGGVLAMQWGTTRLEVGFTVDR